MRLLRRRVERNRESADIEEGSDAFLVISRRWDDLFVEENLLHLAPAVHDAFALTALGMGYGEDAEDAASAAVTCAQAGYVWRQAEGGDLELAEWRVELAPSVAHSLAETPHKEIPGVTPRGRLLAFVAYDAFEAQLLLERGSPVPPGQGANLLRAATTHLQSCIHTGFPDFPLTEQEVKKAFVLGMLIYDCEPLVPEPQA